jgi:hypothetical protein
MYIRSFILFLFSLFEVSSFVIERLQPTFTHWFAAAASYSAPMTLLR